MPPSSWEPPVPEGDVPSVIGSKYCGEPALDAVFGYIVRPLQRTERREIVRLPPSIVHWRPSPPGVKLAIQASSGDVRESGHPEVDRQCRRSADAVEQADSPLSQPATPARRSPSAK
jgi:hypothetical protein